MAETTQELTGKEYFLTEYARQAGPEADGRGWATELRRAARERFGELGFPTTRHEEWRFTNVAPLAATAFRPATLTPEAEAGAEQLLAGVINYGNEAGRLVFINGQYAAQFSHLAGLPAGALAGSLAHAACKRLESVERHLGQYAPWKQHAFAALNTAFMTDGAFIHIPRGMAVERPLHLIYLTVGPGEEPVAAHPRNLFVLEESSQCCVIESYLGPDSQPYFNNPVTEIVLAENATLEHYRLEEEGLAASHIGVQQAQLASNATLTSFSIAVGGALTRADITATLLGEGIENHLYGLYLASGRQHIDHHTRIEHASPHCHSNQLYKGIIDEQGSTVFNGRIHVWPDAQKTDAVQNNRNLLLTDTATANTQPQLEIYADDVRCTHGATVGQLDADALFYLQARGIDEATARGLLTYAFAGEVVAQIKIEPLRARLERLIHDRFTGTNQAPGARRPAAPLAAAEE